MTVLNEILEWSQGRPDWQRDALRRLVQNGELLVDDISDLAEICKAKYGLAERQDIVPLAEEHVPDRRDTSVSVSLVSIFHHRGVNALAERQTLSFAPNLTTVYGDNAAGKTGYIRILKSACRARGQEEILGNVISGTTPFTPAVAIKYKVDEEDESREWSGQGEDPFISRVSIFDTHCAAVYLTEKTDVAFRPFGLDLFDKLVQACKAIRKELESEQRKLATNSLAILQSQVPAETAVSKLLTNITSLTTPESVLKLSRLSPEEEARLETLEKSLLDLKANDPQKLIRQLILRAGRFKILAQHMKGVEETLSTEATDKIFKVRTQVRQKTADAKRLRDTTFPVETLDGTGSQLWAQFWESARHFSQKQAYPNQPFPVVDGGAHCVLCQQELDHDACRRLTQYENFVISPTERDLRQIRESFTHLQRTISDFEVMPESIVETLKEIRINHKLASESIRAAIATAEERREAITLALSEDRDLDERVPQLVSVQSEIDAIVDQIEERLKTLRSSTTDEAQELIASKVKELRARKMLALHEQLVLDEIERRRKYAAYSLSINDTKTQAITLKSSALTRKAVTQTLRKSFQDELSRLNFQHVEVEIREAGGVEGVLYHRLILTRAPEVKLPRVVSEGEQRCLSIAAFFAELSTADELSGIVFDDPVSSLDYKWRESVAQRLVEEANNRQVIVFTHDIVFLLLLKQFAGEKGVAQRDQHVRQLSIGAGVCNDELPWVALKVSKRIGHLNMLYQAAEKLHRQGHRSAYEHEASLIYGLLREAWERAVEEVLIGGVVERYRASIQTKQVTLIADITTEDCKAVENGMTKCSKWLPGHDLAPAAHAGFPEPSVLRTDIDALVKWVASIRKRRK